MEVLDSSTDSLPGISAMPSMTAATNEKSLDGQASYHQYKKGGKEGGASYAQAVTSGTPSPTLEAQSREQLGEEKKSPASEIVSKEQSGLGKYIQVDSKKALIASGAAVILVSSIVGLVAYMRARKASP